jgi:hypothetical protein
MGIFLFTTASRTALGPTQPPIQGVQGALSLEVKRPGVKLTTPPNTPSWRNAQLKHRDNFTFNFTTNFAFPFSYFKLITGLLDKYVGLVVDFSVMPQLIYIVHISSYLNVKVTSLCFFLNEHHAMKAYLRSGGIAPRIL